jgi:hypothetical protein
MRHCDDALKDLQVHEVEGEGKLAEAHQHRTPKRRPASLEVGGGRGGDAAVHDREAEVEERFARQRPSDEVEGEEVLDLGKPGLDEDEGEASHPAAVGSVLRH